MWFKNFMVAVREWFEDHSPVMSIGYAIIVAMIMCFVGVFIIEYSIDDNTKMPIDPKYRVSGGSTAVGMVATLMDREINDHTWSPNRPMIYPIAWGDDMQQYQLGIQTAVARWAGEMADTLGRNGSGEQDVDLTGAAGNFKFDPTSFMIPSAVSEYNDGIARLDRYNRRLASGQARYDRIPSRLGMLLMRIESDLGSQNAIIELMVMNENDITDEEKRNLTPDQRKLLSNNGGYFDTKADDVFFQTKGRMYAYYVILKAVGEDFRDVIEAKHLTAQWESMLISLRSGAQLYNWSISNGSNMSWVVPSHLSNIGFFLGRADKQMRDVAELLSK